MEEEPKQVTVDDNPSSHAGPGTEASQGTNRHESDSTAISRVWMVAPQPRFTFFHALWLAGVIGAGVFGLGLTAHRDWSLFARAAVVLAAVVGGLLVFHLLIFTLVTVLVIPRLGRFTYWAYEVECYMLFVLGDAWRNAGKVKGDPRNTPTRRGQTDR